MRIKTEGVTIPKPFRIKKKEEEESDKANPKKCIFVSIVL